MAALDADVQRPQRASIPEPPRGRREPPEPGCKSANRFVDRLGLSPELEVRLPVVLVQNHDPWPKGGDQGRDAGPGRKVEIDVQELGGHSFQQVDPRENGVDADRRSGRTARVPAQLLK